MIPAIPRRTFTAGALALAAAPGGAWAQQPTRLLRIVYFGIGVGDTPTIPAFQEGLRDHGYEDGRNIAVDYVITTSGQLPQRAAEIVASRPALVVGSTTPPTLALMRETKTIPIVAVNVGSPLDTGMAATLARPAGNVTGFANSTGDSTAKRIELLKETVPTLRRVAILTNPDNASSAVSVLAAIAAAPAFGLEMRVFEARGADDLDRAFDAMVAEAYQAVLMIPDSTLTNIILEITALASKHRLPTVSTQRVEATAGVLLTYGTDTPALYRRSVDYVDRILKGAKPGDLPFQLPIKFELIINAKTAKALGLEIPLLVLARADEVIDP